MKIDKIFLDKDFKTKKEVFLFLGEVLQSIEVVDNKDVYIQAIYEREEVISTGLMNGFALPHGKNQLIKRPAVIYLRNHTGIEWGSLDESLITDIFALAIPTEGATNHLDSLIEISTQLVDDDVCEKLRLSNNEEEIQRIFE